ncbi:probable ubiquitin receptor RAD23a [Syzygium oleosum]|uniref:probable ubiquitin receptor RAD23a n=1 Tax=Syzygium oleosum TaxID=219896 RepID=UPI0011D18F8C|nr:probable ubiquitin receptor RAD23a [Syzygium oleosum]
MKLTVKTLKGTNLEIKVQPSDTIMAVKKNIEDVQDNYPCGQQLLIHSGKVLKDETTLADNKVSGDGFLVVEIEIVEFQIQSEGYRRDWPRWCRGALPRCGGVAIAAGNRVGGSVLFLKYETQPDSTRTELT